MIQDSYVPTNQPEVSKVQSGLGRPEQRWRAPARNKIALWSVLPGAAIVIVVGSLFWASVWIAVRTPTTKVVSAPSEVASVPGVESVPGEAIASGPTDSERSATFALAPSDADGSAIRDDQDDSDDDDLLGDLAMANKPADLDGADAKPGQVISADRDLPADRQIADDRASAGDQAIADSRMSTDDGISADDRAVADGRWGTDAILGVNGGPAVDARLASDGQQMIDGQDDLDATILTNRSDDDDVDADELADTGMQFGPDFGPDQVAAVLAWANGSDDGNQVADGSSQALDRAGEIAARAGELTVRAEELTARIDGLTAKIEELQQKLEAGTALTVQPSPVPVPQTAAARPGQNGAQQKPTVSLAALSATPTPTAAPGKAPWVVMPVPEPGSKVAAGPLVLETRARGAAPITQIRLQIDGATLPVSLDRRDDATWRGRASTRVAAGSHTVAVAVVDSEGRIGSYRWQFNATPS